MAIVAGFGDLRNPLNVMGRCMFPGRDGVHIGNQAGLNINPGVSIAGKVAIDDFCFIGIGASIRENLHLAKNTTIGGGAMVTKDTKPNKTYAGVPAKILVQSARLNR